MTPETRPWGTYQVLYKDDMMLVKKIVLNARSRFSLQIHNRREEKWTVVSGFGVATVGDEKIHAEHGTQITVPRGQVHRLENTTDQPLILVEVQMGDYLAEDDIIRLSDDFGRA